MKKIAIIGGGACGMFGAICAKRAGADVLLLEHTERIGKKLLATGNGKCNLTNLVLKPGDYYGNHPSFVVPVLKRFNQYDTLKLFEEMGLVWKETNGLVYPYSNQASTVLDLLRVELKRLQVRIQTEIKVKEILPDEKKGFLLKTSEGELEADCVILACGSKAAPKTGSDGSGYQLAKKLGHSVIEPLPALVQLKAEGSYFKMIAGVRSDCRLRLYIEEKENRKKILAGEEMGEVQFTDYGISGIPVFQFSRFAVKALWEKKKAFVVCDFLPQMEETDLYEYLVAKQKRLVHEGCCEELLLGLLNKKLNLMLLKECGFSPQANAGRLSTSDLKKLSRLIKHWKISLKGYNSFEQGQICQGGIATEELTENLESRLHKGLYFAGEIIDIDGRCGGYNLQWAWSCAYVAAVHAAKGALAEKGKDRKISPDGHAGKKEK
ncbi:MAG: aminoacetone oxidase family FAD-binding enzyme [Roseburia sp.]|nr:aminoacetone oxidase family FAD-binding enzyme [Roseburia sp.]MCM1279218.1 aminoacetone oxidase family FAD-binding enzyme [Robinsoniella sp.]